MIVGDVVILKVPMLNEVIHAVGVVFNDELDCVQVIFEKGNYDGYNKDEQELFLKKVGEDPTSRLYDFKNVMRVSRDYDEGLWDHVFAKPVYNAFKS